MSEKKPYIVPCAGCKIEVRAWAYIPEGESAFITAYCKPCNDKRKEQAKLKEEYNSKRFKIFKGPAADLATWKDWQHQCEEDDIRNREEEFYRERREAMLNSDWYKYGHSATPPAVREKRHECEKCYQWRLSKHTQPNTYSWELVCGFIPEEGGCACEHHKTEDWGAWA